MHETLDWKECEEEVEKFQKEHILRYIIDTEISENTYPFRYRYNCCKFFIYLPQLIDIEH